MLRAEEEEAMPAFLLFEGAVESSPDTLWWLWLLVAGGFIVAIIYLVGRITPGGPWVR